jgi:uncharacterized protein
MYRKPSKRNKLKPVITIILTILIFSLGYFTGDYFNETKVTYYNETKSVSLVTYIPYDAEANASFSSIVIPAVDEEGNGVTTVLTVQAIPGQGRVLANIDKLLFWTDTQNSIRTSSKVASNITGIDPLEYDIIYTIETNATSVEGPSAGAALTIATIAALEGKSINPDVMITGAINHDGTIGPVGEILPKARAAKEIGAELILVPLLQSQEVTYETRRYCEQIGPAQICTTEKVPRKVDISEETGIEVREVQTIQEALDYFLV